MTTNTAHAAILSLIPLVTDIVESLSLEKATLSEEAKKHNEEVTTTQADKLRVFAKAVKEAGVPVADAVNMLRFTLTSQEVKKGTVLAYGHAVAGFHKLLESGADIDKKSTKDAMNAMRSDEQVEKDLIRADLKVLVRDANVTQLRALKEYAEGLGIAVKARKVRSDKADAPTQEEAAPVAVAA